MIAEGGRDNNFQRILSLPLYARNIGARGAARNLGRSLQCSFTSAVKNTMPTLR